MNSQFLPGDGVTFYNGTRTARDGDGVCEFPLSMFSQWYCDLKFKPFVKVCEDSGENLWQFKVVYYFPQKYNRAREG